MGNIFEVGHAAHVNPGLGHRHHHIGLAKAERGQHRQAGIGVGHIFAHQVFPGHSQMGRACGQVSDDFGRREKGDFHTGQLRQRAAIVARAACLHHVQPGAGEKVTGIFLQPALGGHSEDEGGAVAHAARSGRRSIQMAAPTAGISWPPLSCASKRS